MYNFLVLAESEEEKIRFEQLFERYAKKYRDDYTVKTEIYKNSFWENYRPVYDVVFMELNEKRERASWQISQFRKVDRFSLLVPMVAAPELALMAYEIGSINCFLSRSTDAEFFKSMKRTLELLDDWREFDMLKGVVIRVEDTLVKLPFNRIFFIESDGNYLVFHSSAGEYRTRGTMKKIEKQFADIGFLKANKSVLVNGRFIQDVRLDCVSLAGNHTIELSRRESKNFRDAYEAFKQRRQIIL